MKISPQQYASSLYDSVAGKSPAEVKVALKNFVAILGRERVFGKEEEIIAAFQEIWSRENGEMTATIASAHELSLKSQEMIVNYLKNRTGSEKITLTETVDKSLIGGFVLKYESKVLDGSLKSSLAELKTQMEK